MGIVARFFHFDQHKTSFKQELIAGITTFATVAYIIILIPSFLAEAAIDFNAAMTATLIAAAFSTLLMGLYANYPFVLGPGIALAVYFSYSVVIEQKHPWQAALGIVFIVGLLFILLNILGIRKYIIEAIPASLRTGVIVGLGLFLALIGLRNGSILAPNPNTLFSFAYPFTLKSLFFAIGLITMGTLLALRVFGALFLGIALSWLLALFFGLISWQGFVAWPSSLNETLFQFQLKELFSLDYLSIFISFVFVALFDSSGTLLALGQQIGCVEERGKRCHFPGITRALFPDSTGSLLAGALGTSTVAVYIESAAGIAVGGRTGFVSVVVALLFILSLFFIPFAASIPLFATAPALVIVGAMMVKNVRSIEWKEPSEWLPAFITLIIIPLTYSIANGIAVGYITYCIIKLCSGKSKQVHPLSWFLAALFIMKFLL